MIVTPEQARFQAALELVDRAFDLPPAGRAALLEAERDPEVRAQARRLLQADERTEDFLGEPAAGFLPSAVAALARAEQAATAGDCVGPFHLLAPRPRRHG